MMALVAFWVVFVLACIATAFRLPARIDTPFPPSSFIIQPGESRSQLRIGRRTPVMDDSPDSTLTIVYLKDELGLDDNTLTRILIKYPSLLYLKVETNIIPKVEVLQSFGFSTRCIASMVSRIPSLLALNADWSIPEKLIHLRQSFAFSMPSLVSVVVAEPVLLSMSKERHLETVRFFRKTVGLSTKDMNELLVSRTYLLTTSIESMHECWSYLRDACGFSEAEARRVVLQNPRVLRKGLLFLMDQRLEILTEHIALPPLHFAETQRLFLRLPSLLTLDPEFFLRPNLAILRDLLGLSPQDLKATVLRCPSLLVYRPHTLYVTLRQYLHYLTGLPVYAIDEQSDVHALVSHYLKAHRGSGDKVSRRISRRQSSRVHMSNVLAAYATQINEQDALFLRASRAVTTSPSSASSSPLAYFADRPRSRRLSLGVLSTVAEKQEPDADTDAVSSSRSTSPNDADKMHDLGSLLRDDDEYSWSSDGVWVKDSAVDAAEDAGDGDLLRSAEEEEVPEEVKLAHCDLLADLLYEVSTVSSDRDASPVSSFAASTSASTSSSASASSASATDPMERLPLSRALPSMSSVSLSTLRAASSVRTVSTASSSTAMLPSLHSDDTAHALLDALYPLRTVSSSPLSSSAFVPMRSFTVLQQRFAELQALQQEQQEQRTQREQSLQQEGREPQQLQQQSTQGHEESSVAPSTSTGETSSDRIHREKAVHVEEEEDEEEDEDEEAAGMSTTAIYADAAKLLHSSATFRSDHDTRQRLYRHTTQLSLTLAPSDAAFVLTRGAFALTLHLPRVRHQLGVLAVTLALTPQEVSRLVRIAPRLLCLSTEGKLRVLLRMLAALVLQDEDRSEDQHRTTVHHPAAVRDRPDTEVSQEVSAEQALHEYRNHRVRRVLREVILRTPNLLLYSLNLIDDRLQVLLRYRHLFSASSSSSVSSAATAEDLLRLLPTAVKRSQRNHAQFLQQLQRAQLVYLQRSNAAAAAVGVGVEDAAEDAAEDDHSGRGVGPVDAEEEEEETKGLRMAAESIDEADVHGRVPLRVSAAVGSVLQVDEEEARRTERSVVDVQL